MKVIKVESSNQFRAANVSKNPNFKGFQNCIKQSPLTDVIYSNPKTVRTINQFGQALKKMKTNVSFFFDANKKNVYALLTPDNKSVANNSFLEGMTRVKEISLSDFSVPNNFNNFLLDVSKDSYQMEKVLGFSADARKVLTKVQVEKV